MQTVIKVQRALNADKVLIYNRERSVFQELPLDESFEEVLGNRSKAYFEVRIDDAGVMHIGDEVRRKW